MVRVSSESENQKRKIYLKKFTRKLTREPARKLVGNSTFFAHQLSLLC